MSLTDQLKALEKTPRFQKMAAEAAKKAAKAGQTFGQGKEAVSVAVVLRRCERLKELLYQETVKVIPSVKLDHILVGTPVIDQNGNYVVNIEFDRRFAHRDSLFPQRYDGVDNIFLHMTHGWHAKDRVYGAWRDSDVASRTSFDGSDFIQRAVEKFNKEMRGVALAEIDPMYQ